MKNKFWLVFFLSLIFQFVCNAQAQTVDLEFATEELSPDTLTPVLDSPIAVMSRRLSYKKTIETALLGGWMLDEPFYSNQFLGLSFLYSSDEFTGYGLAYRKWSSGISSYSEQFKGANSLNLAYGYGPDMSATFLYERRSFYGKISFSKGYVMPVSIGSQFELGAIKYGSRMLPIASVSLCHKIYFTNSSGIQTNLRLAFHQALDPLSVDLKATTRPSEGDFATTTDTSTMLDLAYVYLF